MRSRRQFHASRSWRLDETVSGALQVRQLLGVRSLCLAKQPPLARLKLFQ
jgi:hypothetical protein